MQPDPRDYDYPLDEALSAVVGLRSEVPEDAFTAGTLGTERRGHGVIIRDSGLVLTIGYLVTEASTIWLTTIDGRVLAGDLLGYDQETGFGLVQALGRLEQPALALGVSSTMRLNESVVLAGSGGRRGAVAARVIGKHAFAGYWEYAIDDALFTAPAHGSWGGAALIGSDGTLRGIGSLQLQAQRSDGGSEDVNMVVPIDLVKPVLDDLETLGRPNKPSRPWLGLFATEMSNRVVIVGVLDKGPAAKARVRSGDIVIEVAGHKVGELAEFYKTIWALGDAGVEVPVVFERDGRVFKAAITSGDRRRFLKGPVLH